jgi:predicted enzyme related to lactoylglutathione lyase
VPPRKPARPRPASRTAKPPAKKATRKATHRASAARRAPAPERPRAVRPQPLLAVRDVHASMRFYEQVLDARRLGESDHDHIYQRLLRDGELLLQLHSWDDEDHPNLVDPDKAPPGHGVLIWFEVLDFDAAVARIRASGARVIEEPHVNPNARHREIWIEDPDGYVVVLASPDGEAA